jgi:hypothetical protein
VFFAGDHAKAWKGKQVVEVTVALNKNSLVNGWECLAQLAGEPNASIRATGDDDILVFSVSAYVQPCDAA